MKILFITRKFPPSVGGMENFAKDLYASLAKVADVSLIKWGGSNKFLPLVVPAFFFAGMFKILKDRPDIIHIQDGLLSPLGFIFSRLFRKPYTVVIHGLDITYENKFFQFLIPKAVANADRVFCISRAAADQAIERGVPRSKTEVIPLGAENKHKLNRKEAKKFLDSYKEGMLRDKKLLLTVGRLVKRKGVEWFIRSVLPKLIQKDSNIRYLVVGDGEERENIRQAISETNMEDYALMLGKVSNTELSALYKGSEVFVMPNIPVSNDMEGFGIVLVEASLCSIPIVATGIEGILDATKDGVSAYHVAPFDKKGFSDKILFLLDDYERALKFAEKGKRYTELNYSWKSVASHYEAEFRRIL